MDPSTTLTENYFTSRSSEYKKRIKYRFIFNLPISIYRIPKDSNLDDISNLIGLFWVKDH